MAKAPADIRSAARSHTETAINTLVGIMKEPRSPAAARVAAAIALLDRGWGKPKETLQVEQKHEITDWTDAELLAVIDNDLAGGNK